MFEADYTSHIWMIAISILCFYQMKKIYHRLLCNGAIENVCRVSNTDNIGLTLNEFWSSGYWFISRNLAVKKMIFHCVQCNRLCGKLAEQKMADLSDYPGSFIHVLWSRHAWLSHNKTKKESVSDYGAMFTCTSCQAVHIEITHSHLLIALRHLIASRGKVQQSSWTMVAVSLDLRMSWGH